MVCTQNWHLHTHTLTDEVAATGTQRVDESQSESPSKTSQGSKKKNTRTSKKKARSSAKKGKKESRRSRSKSPGIPLFMYFFFVYNFTKHFSLILMKKVCKIIFININEKSFQNNFH
jgi:hypothetical protein